MTRSVSARTPARIVARVARRMPEGRWLDVGFANGSPHFTAEEWDFTAAGLNLREANVRVLNQLAYEAHCLPIAALDHNARYGVIGMADVLEPMPFPTAGLAAAHRLLRPDGALCLSMPNIDNTVWRLLHANGVDPYWGEIEHYHNLSRERLYALLQEHGFTPVEYHISERYRVRMEMIAIKHGRRRETRRDEPARQKGSLNRGIRGIQTRGVSGGTSRRLRALFSGFL